MKVFVGTIVFDIAQYEFGFEISKFKMAPLKDK